MALDMLQMLVDILKISPQVLSQYSMLSPLEQIFYIFLFPTLFIIILIYIVSTHWISHKGLGILIAVALYAFIIFQGLYNSFVILSKFWLFGLLILGGIWFVFRPKKEGGGAKGLTSKEGKKGGLMSQLQRRFKGEITQEFKQREQMIMGMLKQVEDAIKKAGTDISDIDNILGGAGGVMMMMTRIYQMIWDLRNDEQVMGFAGPKVVKLIKEYNRVARQIGIRTLPEGK